MALLACSSTDTETMTPEILPATAVTAYPDYWTGTTTLQPDTYTMCDTKVVITNVLVVIYAQNFITYTVANGDIYEQKDSGPQYKIPNTIAVVSLNNGQCQIFVTEQLGHIVAAQ